MPQKNVGGRIVNYPEPVKSEELQWEPVEENSLQWEPVDEDKDQGLLSQGWDKIKKGWEVVNTPVTSYLPESARNLVRKGLAYNPLFDIGATKLGLSDQTISGLEAAKENIGESLLTPLSLGTMGLGGPLAQLPKLVKMGIAGTFGGMSAKGAYEQGKEYLKARQEGDKEEQARALTETIAQLGFAGLGGLGLREAYLARPKGKGAPPVINPSGLEKPFVDPELSNRFYESEVNEPLPTPWLATSNKGKFLVSNDKVDAIIKEKYPQLDTASQTVKRQFLIDKLELAPDVPAWKFDRGIEKRAEADEIVSNPPVKRPTYTAEGSWGEGINKFIYDKPPESPAILKGPWSHEGPLNVEHSLPLKTSAEIQMARPAVSLSELAKQKLMESPEFQKLSPEFQQAFLKSKLGAQENVSQNQQGMASQVGVGKEPIQTDINQNPSGKTLTPGGVVQTSPKSKGLIIPISKYSDIGEFKRSNQALGITNPKAAEVAEHLTKKFEELRKEFGDFVPTIVKELSQPKPFGITPDKEGKMNPASLKAKILVRLSKAEQEMLKTIGFDKLLDEASKGNQKVNLQELLSKLKEDAPKVEVKPLVAGETETSAIEKQFAELQHTYYDSIKADEMPKFNRSVREAQGNYDKLRENLLKEGFNERMVDGLVKYQQNKNFLESYEGRVQNTQKNESATARYTMVNPKPLDKMPGAVDLLVRIPATIKYEEQFHPKNFENAPPEVRARKGELVESEDKIKFRSQHYPQEGKNLISHVRGYFETLPDGKKVFHVFEVQSDWAQYVREVEADKKAGNIREDSVVSDKYKDEFTDPALQYYEHLALKAAIKHAIDNGADYIAISDANTAMLSEMHDQAAKHEYRLSGEAARRAKNIADEMPRSDFWRRLASGNWIESVEPLENLQKEVGMSGIEERNSIGQEQGMRLHYDQTLPNIARKLTGSEPTKVSFGEHQNVREQYATAFEPGEGAYKGIRDNLILKDPLTGKPQTDIKANLFSLDNLKERVGELKEPFSTYSTLYSGIPLEAFGKAISNTFKDITSPEARAKIKELASVSAKILRAALDNLRDKGGNSGKYLADHLENFFREETRYYGEFVNSALLNMRNYKLPQEQQESLLKYMWNARYGEPQTVTLNPKQKALLAELKLNLKSVHDEQRKLNIMINGVRAAMDNPNYVPGIPSTRVTDIITSKPASMEAMSLRHDWLKHVIKQSKGEINLPEAEKMYSEYIKAISKSNKTSLEFAAIRKAEGFGVPWSWQEKSLPRLFERYGRRVARDFSYFKNLENDPTSRGILGISDQFGDYSKNATKLPGNLDMEPIGSMPEVQDILRWINKDFSKTDAILEAAGKSIRSAMLGVVTSASNYIQNAPKVAPYLTPTQWGLYIKAHFQAKEGLKAAYEKGVARINPAEIANPTLGYNAMADRLNQLSNQAYRIQGGSMVENFTRGLDMALGQLLVTSHMGRAFKGDKKSISVLDTLQKHTKVEDWKTLQNQMPNLPSKWLNEMAATFVERVQQTYDPRDLPMFALRSELSPFLSLNRWSIGAANHIYRDVVEPMKQGNFTPALNYLVVSGIVGAEVLPVLRSILTNKDSRDPSIKEAVLSGNVKEMAIAFANALNLASFGGIAGDMIKAAVEVSQGRTPRGFTFPLVEFVANTLVERTRQAAEAIDNGEPADAVMLQYLIRAVQDNVQTLRIAANHTLNRSELEHQKRVRDYSVYRRLENQPEMQTPSMNPFLGTQTKEFKRTSDFSKIPDLGMKVINRAMERSEGDPMKLSSMLRGLKTSPITWAPSVESNPLEFMKYLEYTRKVKGEKAANDLMNQYAQQLAANKAKSQMIPSLNIGR